MNKAMKGAISFFLMSSFATIGIVPPSAAGPIEDLMSQSIKAAESGDVRAKVMVGFLYESGIGAKADPAAALKWYRAAAIQDDPGGQALVGRAYSNGLGVPRDDQEAIVWFRKAVESELRGFSSQPILFAGGAQGALKAAEGGNFLAEIMVGKMYLTGHGLNQSDVEAARWLLKAAERGQTTEAPLALMYQDGRGGLTKDSAEAMRLYRKSAERRAKVLQDSLTYTLQYACLSAGKPPDCRDTQ